MYLLVLTWAWLAVQGIILFALVPQLSGFYDDLEGDLPVWTQRQAAFSEWMRGAGPDQIVAGWVILGTGAAVVLTALAIIIGRLRFAWILFALVGLLILAAQLWFALAPLYGLVGEFPL